MSVPGLPGWALFIDVVMGLRCNARRRSILAARHPLPLLQQGEQLSFFETARLALVLGQGR